MKALHDILRSSSLLRDCWHLRMLHGAFGCCKIHLARVNWCLCTDKAKSLCAEEGSRRPVAAKQGDNPRSPVEV